MDPIQAQLADLTKRLSTLESKPSMPDHRHNGFDVSRVLWDDVNRKRLEVYHTIQGTNAATATNYGVFWIAPFACFVMGFREVHQTAGSDGSAVTLQLEKLTSGQAPDAGQTLLTTALSLKTTANIVQTGVLTTTTVNLNLAKNDRLCMKDAGTLTSVANVTILVDIIIN